MRTSDLRASLRRVWVQLTTDRRRFGILCTTFAVGLLLWARLIIVSNVSRTAMAGEAAASKAVATPSAADKPVGKDGAAGAGGGRQRVDVQFSRRSERDPFVISPVHFPRPARPVEVKQEPRKLPTEPTEDASQIQARMLARLQQLLGSVRLEAVMAGSMAVIDGRRYRVGDRLQAMGKEGIEFTLTEVRERSVVLEYQGQRFELAMSTPGSSGIENPQKYTGQVARQEYPRT
jgi:type II secretion system (T2SS) protein B